LFTSIIKEKKMMKNYVKGISITFAALVLAACGSTVPSETPSSSTPVSSEVSLTSIVIAGATDVTIPFNEAFNLRTGVTATGNNGMNYTSNITFSSTSSAVNTSTGDLDTTKTGVHAVRYQVSVGSVVVQQWRNITVGQPESTGGMLINPDFALGTAGWDDKYAGAPFFEGDGGTLGLSTESGQLKAVVVAGANPWTPRFGQAKVPFEIGETYEVSFFARSSVNKTIRVQVGEQYAGAPYFANFLSIEGFDFSITTTMTKYSFTFTHNVFVPEVDPGSLLFNLGNVGGRVDATMFFDDISIEETVLGVDTTAPIISGVPATKDVLINSVFNPLAGVTAFDAVDGVITSDIVVEILNSTSQVVSAVNTSALGTFTINYSVEDEAGNEATASTVITIVDTLPAQQWVGYGYEVAQTATNVSLTYTNVAAEWWTNNAQLPVVGFDGTKTKVDFPFVGVSGQSYLFKIEGGPAGGLYASELAIVADGTKQTISLPLTSLTQEQRSNLNLIIVFAQTLGASGTLVVDNWVY
jgi:hypothetical protein